jgi:glycogen debranching enzyme
VLAVDKSYVFMHEDRKTVTEANAKKGRMVSVGGLIYFSRPNNMRRTMEKFLDNTILYLAGRNTRGPVTAWGPCDGVPRTLAVRTRPLRISAGRDLKGPSSSGHMLPRDRSNNSFFDLAGRRALVMGHEDGGIDEVWVHPMRVMRDCQAGIVSGDSIAWLRSPVSLEVRPESFTRVYEVPEGRLTETIYPSFEKAGGLVHYESTAPLRLMIRFRADLRLMWPYDAGALGNLFYGYDEPLHALHVRDTTGSFACIFGADASPSARLEGRFAAVDLGPQGLKGERTEANQIAFGAVYDLGGNAGRVLNFCFTGTSEGARVAEADYRALLEHPKAAHSELVRHYRDLLARSVSISSPDEEFNRLWPWAVVGTDRFVARTPGMGTGLLAGYSTVTRGWNGSQMISGRPGYAWYFGRDAAWSSFAVDGYGDFETVRNQLELYQRFQDISGKIYHELMTSGVVHFDAADSSPLYVILAAHYLRASGDVDFIRKSWPSLQRAMDFMYSTDTDGDGLIENTDVGHGWMEPGGALFGVHSEMHLTVLWAQALLGAGSMARLLGRDDLAERYESDAEAVRVTLNRDFWNPGTQFYNYGKLKDGSYRAEPTAVAAIGALYGMLDDAKARPMLETYAGNGFSTDWGVRAISGLSPLFKPRSYQQGTVWPLMTGWTALGEYTYGRSAQAFMHVMNTMRLKTPWALGFAEEVMHGAVYSPTGVCPHQCWSETNIIHPVIEGMIGWKPNAPGRAADLSPRFPVHWDTVTVSNLCVGASRVRVRLQRSPGSTTYQLELTSGPAVAVSFAPEIADGMAVRRITLDGKAVANGGEVARGVLKEPVIVNLTGRSSVRLEHSGGLAMVPELPRPAPGDSAAGYRIISAGMAASDYVVIVEGKPGTTHDFQLATFDHPPLIAEGADVVPSGRPGYQMLKATFPADPGLFVRKTVVVKIP